MEELRAGALEPEFGGHIADNSWWRHEAGWGLVPLTEGN